MADALSDDDDCTAEVAAAQQRRNAPKVSNKKAAARAARTGTRRAPAFLIPIPLNYLVDGTGYQEYRLPDEKRVFQRREFQYEDQFKTGGVITAKPQPPPLFSSKFLYTKAKKLLVAEEDSDEDLNARTKLVRRLETRVVRLSNNYFIDNNLSTIPDAAVVTASNENIGLIFGAAANEWTQKQVMAWACTRTHVHAYASLSPMSARARPVHSRGSCHACICTRTHVHAYARARICMHAYARARICMRTCAFEMIASQVMAWAWPEIPIIGDAKQHYNSGLIGQQQRDTARLVSICLLSEASGTASHKSLLGVDNRFKLLDSKLRTVADTLSSVAREGLLVTNTTGHTVIRDDIDLDSLFGEIKATHGKKSAAWSAEEYDVGDPVTIKLFDHGIEEDEDDGHLEWVEVEGAADGGYIEMTPEERFLYNLGEAALNKVITSIEQAVPSKKPTYAGSARARGSGAGGSGVSKLSKAGRHAVVMLKQALPKVCLQ